MTTRTEAPPMLAADVRDARAWRRDEVTPADWLVALSPSCLAELDAVAHRLRHDPLPALVLAPEQFALDACAEVMRRVRDKLRTGVGLAVLDRVPVERYSLEENRALAWVLGSLLGRLVAQKWDGTMVYDVHDTGRQLEYGVRRSVTNLDLVFHTDAAWLDLPPELVGLYCINPAREGGVSRFVSLVSVHNQLARRHPDLLPRFYRAFPWDRQAEHAPGDDKVSRRPIFQCNGGAFMACVNEKLVETGAELAGEPLDDESREALAAMRALLESPELWVEFTIERGQLQFINNRQFAHSRTDFKDASEPHLKRHMIRLWTREEGRRSFRA